MDFFRKKESGLFDNLSIDGPYVFYKEDTIEVVSVVEDQKKHILKQETLLYSQKDSVSLECVVDNHEKERFTVKLKNEHKIPESRYPKQDKIIVTSDLEGNFYAFSTLLKGNGIVDDNYNWIFGRGHLVIIGDIMDRGRNVTQCLWLIYKLEQEAERTGGKVHFMLGNHEVINMKGVTGFVKSKYLQLSKVLNINYYRFCSSETELGTWMRSKNTIEVIGDIAFVHAGLCPGLVDNELKIDELNEIVRNDIDCNSMGLGDRKQIVLGNKGLLWYRGMVRDADDYFKLTMEELDRILKYYDINRIVIGHTKENEITSSYEGKVYRTDIAQPKSIQEGKSKALLIENGTFFKINSDGVKEEFC